MKQTSVIGYPRIGADRELKKWTEAYFRRELEQKTLFENAEQLRTAQWQTQQASGIRLIPSNDFSFYDTFLDMAFFLHAIPQRYLELGLDPLDTYFAMAKGYQGPKGDVHALPMKKWFNTNYHYIVPEIDGETVFRRNGDKPFREFREAMQYGICTKPVIIGPLTFLRLAENKSNKSIEQLAKELLPVYSDILREFKTLGAAWVQIDEPYLVTDLCEEDRSVLQSVYRSLLSSDRRPRVLLQTYFGDVRDSYEQLVRIGFDGIGLDFVEGTETLSLIEKYGFPKFKLLFAGVVNGKNVWVNHYAQTLELVRRLEKAVDPEQIVLSTSCSLLHVPYTVKSEPQLDETYRVHLAFAQEKLTELSELARLSDEKTYGIQAGFLKNEEIIGQKQDNAFCHPDVREQIKALDESAFHRKPSFKTRQKLQKDALRLPPLPTTTIGSFPQTGDVRQLRRDYKNGAISATTYETAIQRKIADVIALQEEIGLDVLVHGEYERNDMVEYFGEKLSGFLFTKNAWVQSYGTRCVKPPIIFGDVKRLAPMTVGPITYAQSLTQKPVKGMLTGPVTILNWSFPREDLSRKEIAFQIALAIKAEVEDLEAHGIRIIQIDEAALREKLPLRKCDWHTQYLDWAIPAFRLVHASVRPETQIHTHMCYSEFGDIIKDIDDMDADVITFEAARSDLSLIDVLNGSHFKTEVGPGVYDIHSPRIPDEAEIESSIQKMIAKLDIRHLWVNPDCGLKTRGLKETIPSLKHMVQAARTLREEIPDNTK